MEPEDIFDEATSSNSVPLLVNGRGRMSSSAAMTGALVFSTFIAVLGSFVFGSSVGFSSPAQSGILKDLGLSLAEYSFFGSISTIGALVGAVVSGKVADMFGRRGAMGITGLFNIFGWLAIVFSKNAWWLDIGRVSTGFGVGIISYVVPVYIAEIAPKNLRGAFTAGNQLMICIGSSTMYIVGNIITWRLLALTGIFPCVIQLLGLPFIPESPRWLAKNGQWDDSKSCLLLLRGKRANILEEAAEIRDYTVTLEQSKESRIMELFQRKYAHSLLIGVGLMVLQQFGGVNAIGYYASSIFVSAGFSERVGTTAMVIIKVPMTVLGVLLMDKSGRHPLLLVSAGGTCLGCFLIGLSFLLQERTVWESSPFLSLGGVLVINCNLTILNVGISYGNSHVIGSSEQRLLILSSDFYGIFLFRHGRHSLGYNVRDISNKCERNSWKLGGSGKLVWFLGYNIFIQLSCTVELRRYIFHFRSHLWFHDHLRHKACTGNEGMHFGRNTGVLDILWSRKIATIRTPQISLEVAIGQWRNVRWWSGDFGNLFAKQKFGCAREY